MRLETGTAAPFFSRRDDAGNEVTLDDYAGHALVLFFYPKAFTPGCTAESCDFRDRHEAFYAAGYEIIGVSPDPVDELARFRSEHALPYPMLSDPDHAMAEAYGAWGMKKNYGREYEGLIRSTIVIDADGLVERAWYNVKATGHAERVARDLAVG
ncbi:MAG: thioredoxin-dependent thiol peroxidase [Acidimicrobiia bacterium]|nr:thioredoxin-dependent thiol peroxidase [Acidimicrobiia bacterium]